MAKFNEEMKSATAINNINKVGQRETAAFRLVNNAISEGRNTIRPAWYSGSGRHVKLVDYTSQVVTLLNNASIKYSLSNDAARGSATGNMIVLTHIENVACQ